MEQDNTLAIVLIVILILFLFFGFGMMGFNGSGGMMGNLGYDFFGMWIFGWLFMALISIALVLFIVWLVKQLQSPRRKKKW